MKYYIFLILFFLLPLVRAQEHQTVSKDAVYNIEIVDKKPEYPGGRKEFLQFIGKNFKDPDAHFQGGKVIASFIVETDGSLADIKILRDAGFESGLQIKKLLTISQKWSAGEINGIKVKTSMALPIILPKPLAESSSRITGEEPDESAEFPGGLGLFRQFIKNNFRAPTVDKGVVVSDVAVISFVIGTDGYLKDIKIKKDFGYGITEELVRVFKISPQWKPAKKAGEEIETFFEIPIPIEVANPDVDTSGIIYESEIVQKMAYFPSGMYGLLEYVYSNLEKLEQKIRPIGSNEIKGEVVVEMVVNVDGTLQDFKIMQEYGYRSGLYTIKALEHSPKWIPALKNGKYVRSVYRFAFPVK